MPNMLFANNCNTTLNGGITAIATSMVVTSATGFPVLTGSQYFYCTLADAATQTTIEIVKVTAVSGTTFTIVRGQDGTTGTIFASGAVVSLRLVRASLNNFPKLDEDNTFTGLITASGGINTPTVQASNSGGLALKNSGGTTQMSVGAGGGDNMSINVSTNLNGTNAQIDISPTGTGHVHINPTGSGSVEIKPTNVGTMDNMTIGATTAKNASFVDLSVTGTTSFDGAQGTAGQVLTSAGTGNTPTWTTPTTGTVTSVTGTAPVVSSGGATPAISMAAATTSVNGYLTSTDWTTFNSKAPGTTYTSTYIPFGQGTTTLNQSSALTWDGSNLGLSGGITASSSSQIFQFGGVNGRCVYIAANAPSSGATSNQWRTQLRAVAEGDWSLEHWNGTSYDTRLYVAVSGGVGIGTTVDPGSANLNVTGTGKFGTTVGVGAATPSTSGAGVTFPATQSASTNANTLDDYEEGTWTPNQGAGLTVVGAFTSNGTYTKIGNIVTVRGYYQGGSSLVVTAGGVMSSNLPFTSSASSNSAGSLYTVAPDGAGSVGVTNGVTSVYSPTALACVAITFAITYQV